MELTQDPSPGQYHITAYDKESVSVNGQPYYQSLIIMPGKLITPWPVQNIQSLTEQDFSLIVSLKPNIVLFGTGSQLIYPDRNLFNSLKTHNIGFEVMSTPAACRTYAILVAEDRAVLAALLLP